MPTRAALLKPIAELACRRRRTALTILLAATLFVAWAPPAEAQFVNTPYSTTFGKNKVNYETFDFWKYTAPHFDVYYYPEEEQHLDEVVAFAEDAYRRISQAIDHQLSERMPIIFYQTHSEFQQTHILPFFLPEGVAAFAEPSENRLVLPVDDPPDELHKLIIHEVTHLFEFDYFFGTRIGSVVRMQPPGWVFEGLAEHMAGNLSAIDEMMLRDVVLADDIPTLIQMTYNSGFLIDYVLGQVVWDYIASEYGTEGIRIFLSEIRRDLGQDIERDLERAFNVTPQEFNDDFRNYLRARYLPNALERQEAPDFARDVMTGIPLADRPFAFSPVVSPAGDRFAAISVDERRAEIDIYTFDMKTGERQRNLTGGRHGDFEYIVAQGVTVGFNAGNDLSWSPDGSTIAFFGRTPPTRTLWLVDAADGDVRKEFKTDLDQALSPNIGPDGRVVFAAHRNGVRDIWLYDPANDQISNLTQDELYDYAPVWSPDGQSIVFTSHVLGHKKLFRIDLARPQERVQLTFGLSNDTQPSFALDGAQVYFVSDRNGAHNLYGIELASDTVERYTNILHGAFFPQRIPGTDELLFSAYGDGSYDLYTMELPAPLETFAAVDEDLPDEEIDRIETEMTELTDIELSDENRTQSTGGGWHISNIQIAGGYTTFGGGTVLANTFIQLEDLLGNHQITAVLGSLESQRSYSLAYTNRKHRWNWGVLGTSQRAFFFPFDFNSNSFEREAFFELDGGEVFGTYPFSRDWRAEFSVGYYRREYGANFGAIQGTSDEIVQFNDRFHNGTFLPIGIELIGDKARFKEYGPFSGRRIQIGFEGSPPGVADLEFYNVSTDIRHYFPVTKDSQLAARLWGSASFGDDPTAFFFGGLNQLRGFRYLQFAGSRTALLNVEYRFPIIWEARGGEFALRHIRGLLFFDMGAAWFDDEGFTLFKDGRLEDGVASFGGGIGVNLAGIPLWWFFAQRTDLDSLDGSVDVSFYIGPLF